METKGGGVGKIVTYDTSPAPKNTNLFSDILFLVILFDARIPATATAAVPCISSLNVQYLSRYLSKKRKALWLPKSSNCKTRLHTHTWCSISIASIEIYYTVKYIVQQNEKSRIEWIEGKRRMKKRTWMRTFWPYFFTQAAINSSINSSYSAPWLLGLLSPM